MRINENILELLRPIMSLGDLNLLTRLYAELSGNGIRQAVFDRDTAALGAWFLRLFQMQGMSDAGVAAYVAQNGIGTWAELERDMASGAPCGRLASYWQFTECGYRKGAGTCAASSLIERCPLPRRPFRNGRLSQAAYSFFLFVRDVCDGDLVGWLDGRLEGADDPVAPDRARRMREALLGPLREVYGVSDKVLAMALADLLLGADETRERWVTAGGSMIAIDTLVHNFLHRTGVLMALGSTHAYGPACYGPNGCANIIEEVARSVDARRFNPTFPAFFPRFIQQSIWRFCAADAWNICNGNRINDASACRQRFCPAYSHCARLPLRDAAHRLQEDRQQQAVQ